MNGRRSTVLAIVTGVLLTLAAVSGRAAPDGAADADPPDIDRPLKNDFDLPDAEGLRRDTYYFLAYQWIPIVVLYAAPESISNWSDEQKEGDYLSRWERNVTHPQFDSDDLYLNYILHPYWGATYYVRAKERGYSDSGAFWYSLLLSSIYELGTEAMFEEVSIQDVVFTPMFGSMLGSYFMSVRRDIRQRDFQQGYRRTRDKWLWVLTDPLGALNRQTDRLLGRDTELQVMPYASAQRRDDGAFFESPRQDEGFVYGLQLRLEW